MMVDRWRAHQNAVALSGTEGWSATGAAVTLLDVLLPETTDVAVAFTCDGIDYCIDVPTDFSALRAIREIAGHERPRRGCEQGICGKCESMANGEETRLCQLPAAALDGLDIVTPTPRKSMWAV
jgi:hypothetical protein